MNRHEKYFWSKVDKKKSYECWNWTGGKSNGYGSFGIYEDGKVTGFKAHRYAYELSRRCRIPENMLICHLCDNPLCVNPSHLYCGTGEDNARDRSKNDIIRSTKISLSKAKFYSGEI
ncbi:MAG: HNH endonuclease signature motif containing protein [bacterium]